MKAQNLLYFGIGSTILPLSGCCEKAANTEKPNVIIIYSDDVGIGDLECYGTGVVPTPNVNRLASEGVRFTNSHTTSATSTPSRFGLLSGIYPWRQAGTGIATGDAAMVIRPERYTIADAAKSAGYKTGAVGKWHLGIGSKTGEQNWNGKISPGLSDIGFDYSFIMAATGDRVPCVYIEDGSVYNWDATAPIEVSYKGVIEGEPTGKENPELLKLHPSNGHNQAIVNGVSRIGYMKGGGKALWRDEDIADVITEKAVEFIEGSDEPFLLYFGTNDVHVPRVPNERFIGKSGLGARGDAILQFDYCVGEILDVLDRMGIADNTIIILSSDNGPVLDDGYADQAVELLGDHKPMGPYRGGKYSAFEAGTRVPMIVRWGKNTKNGTVSDAAFSHVDIMASLNKLMGGVRIPDTAKIDSREVVEVLLGNDTVGRDYIIQQNASNTLSVLSGDWKFIRASKGHSYDSHTDIETGNTPEDKLYNLKDDIGEQNNIIASHPDIVVKMKDILTTEIAYGI